METLFETISRTQVMLLH